jgi:hypothetical protein
MASNIILFQPEELKELDQPEELKELDQPEELKELDQPEELLGVLVFKAKSDKVHDRVFEIYGFPGEKNDTKVKVIWNEFDVEMCTHHTIVLKQKLPPQSDYLFVIADLEEYINNEIKHRLNDISMILHENRVLLSSMYFTESDEDRGLDEEDVDQNENDTLAKIKRNTEIVKMHFSKISDLQKEALSSTINYTKTDAVVHRIIDSNNEYEWKEFTMRWLSLTGATTPPLKQRGIKNLNELVVCGYVCHTQEQKVSVKYTSTKCSENYSFEISPDIVSGIASAKRWILNGA